MATNLDRAALAELRRLEAAVTPGEWWHDGEYIVAGPSQKPIIHARLRTEEGDWTRLPDLSLIVALRNAAPALLSLAERVAALDPALLEDTDAND